MTKPFAMFVGVILVTSTTIGQQSLLPTSPSERILIRWVGPNIRLPHNGCDTIAKEVQDENLRKLMLQIVKLPADTALRYVAGDPCTLQVSAIRLSNDSAASLKEVMSDYVQSRAGGHTTRYALDSLKQRLVQPKPETDGFRVSLFETFPHLPRDWVKEDPIPSTTAAATNELHPSKRFVVIDGELAWIYSVRFGIGRATEHKVDAQEVDPKLIDKFDTAQREAEANLAKRGIKKGLGYVHFFTAEVDAILWQKFHIKRRSFRELNPGINF